MKPEEPDRRERDEAVAGVATALIVFVSAAALVLVGGAVGVGFGMHHAGAPMVMNANDHAFMLGGLPMDIQEHYEFAAANPAPYAAVPCFCGCQATLDHRNLLDCFVQADGGWEVHASGCAVCVQESVQIRRLLERGASNQQIHDVVVARFSALAGAPD
jgi:hypothetical protein